MKKFLLTLAVVALVCVPAYARGPLVRGRNNTLIINNGVSAAQFRAVQFRAVPVQRAIVAPLTVPTYCPAPAALVVPAPVFAPVPTNALLFSF